MVDNATASIITQLVEDPYGAATATLMAAVQSAGASPAEQTLVDNTIVSPDVNTAANHYKVTVCLGGTSQLFYGAKVIFTYP